jgi:phosphinothricin acetyltransferase
MTPSIRPATEADLPTIVEIYNQGIRGRGSTFETRERTVDDIRGWLGNPRHPLLVAESNGKVLGWISASSYRARECYAGIAEFSVYVHQNARGQGIGDALVKAFIPACEQAGLWKILSRIFPENKASLALCRRNGFREVGVYKCHGKLDGVWRDTVIVEYVIEQNLY